MHRILDSSPPISLTLLSRHTSTWFPPFSTLMTKDARLFYSVILSIALRQCFTSWRIRGTFPWRIWPLMITRSRNILRIIGSVRSTYSCTYFSSTEQLIYLLLAVYYSNQYFSLFKYGCCLSQWPDQLIWTIWLFQRRYYVENLLLVCSKTNADPSQGSITTSNGKIGMEPHIFFPSHFSDSTCHFTYCAICFVDLAVLSTRGNSAVASNLWMRSIRQKIPYVRIVKLGSCCWSRTDSTFTCTTLLKSFSHSSLSYLVFRKKEQLIVQIYDVDLNWSTVNLSTIWCINLHR